MQKLSGKTALVTGAGQGIGRGVALCLAKEGADVAIADINYEKALEVVREVEALGVKALAIQVDVTRWDQVDAMVKQCTTQFGQLDIAVNNAGVLGASPVGLLTEEEWDRVMGVNAKGVFLCTKAELAHMVERGTGKIINISSAAGKQGFAMLPHYCASKFAVLGFTNSVAKEMARTGVTVNAICPGILGTEMWIGGLGLAALLKQPEETLEESWQRNQQALIPQGVAQTPEDIGDAVVFLATADHVTGQAINVDGGMVYP